MEHKNINKQLFDRSLIFINKESFKFYIKYKTDSLSQQKIILQNINLVYNYKPNRKAEIIFDETTIKKLIINYYYLYLLNKREIRNNSTQRLIYTNHEYLRQLGYPWYRYRYYYKYYREGRYVKKKLAYTDRNYFHHPSQGEMPFTSDDVASVRETKTYWVFYDAVVLSNHYRKRAKNAKYNVNKYFNSEKQVIEYDYFNVTNKWMESFIYRQTVYFRLDLLVFNIYKRIPFVAQPIKPFPKKTYFTYKIKIVPDVKIPYYLNNIILLISKSFTISDHRFFLQNLENNNILNFNYNRLITYKYKNKHKRIRKQLLLQRFYRQTNKKDNLIAPYITENHEGVKLKKYLGIQNIKQEMIYETYLKNVLFNKLINTCYKEVTIEGSFLQLTEGANIFKVIIILSIIFLILIINCIIYESYKFITTIDDKETDKKK